MNIKHQKTQSFKTAKEFGQWLAENHAVEQEIWVKLFKKRSYRPSPNWEECVVEALTWGWIDGLKKPLDEEAIVKAASETGRIVVAPSKRRGEF